MADQQPMDDDVADRVMGPALRRATSAEEAAPPPIPLSRKKELFGAAVAIAEIVRDLNVRGRELCLLDNFAHTLVQH